MKVKILNYLLSTLVLFTVQSCGQNRKINNGESTIEVLEDSKTIENLKDNEATESVEDEAIKTLKEFYTAYMSGINSGINRKAEDSILNKYVTKELLVKIKKAYMDYDPLIKGQDASLEGIETLEFTSIAGQKGIYVVCYTVQGYSPCIKLSLIKINDRYMINDILDEDLSEGQNEWDVYEDE